MNAFSRWGALLVVLALGTIVGGQPAGSKQPAQVEALAEFQQAVYEFALGLILDDDRSLRADMSHMWMHLTQLRERTCPKDLKQHVREAAQVSALNDQLPAKLDLIEKDLSALASGLDVSAAQARLKATREAYEKKQVIDYRRECQAIMDAVVGAQVGASLDTVIPILRRASDILTSSTSAASREKAMNTLKELPNFEKGKARAFRDALMRADRIVAAAADLYFEGYYLQGKQQLVQTGPPLALAQRTAATPEMARQVDLLGQELREADRLMTQGWTFDAERGLARLRHTRVEMGQLYEKSQQSIVEGQAVPK